MSLCRSQENATNISTTTATLNGTILFAGTPMYTERGFVYDTLPEPTLATTQKKVSLTSTAGDSYSAGITDLHQGTKYYVRAYAVNVSGTSYSTNEVDFTTQVLLPTLTTQAATDKNVAAGTATFNGTILTVGDPAYTERGFVYGLNLNPTTNNTKKTVAGTGVGTFNAGIDSLTEGNVYHIRSYAINMAGTAYGNDTTLNFVITMPTVSTQNITNQSIATGTATFNGTLVSVGDLPITERGFVYATTANPTLDNSKVIATGTGTGAFNANVTGLTEGSTYHVRAYATNSKGTVYGEGISFAFIATLPKVSTQAVTNRDIVAGTATFNGTLITVGDPACTERGFVYSTTANPTLDDSKVIATGTGTGAFNANVTGLTEGSTYHVRAYATNSNSTVYGEEVSVDFNAVMPTVSTQAVTNKDIVAGTATFNGTILTAGNLEITERGFVYATTTSPTLDDSKVIATGTDVGAFNVDTTDFAEGNVYYVRAYATNSKGTVYGNEVSVDFNVVMPTVSTQAVTNKNIATGTATFNGTILTVGDPAYTERGFVHATTANPTLGNSKVIATGTGMGAFNANVTGITEGNVYYVRAYATNSKGTVYGNEVSLNLSICGIDFTDSRDNQVYPIVQIGTQCWMSKNMSIGERVDGSNYITAYTAGIQKICYDNSESNCDIYGGLYSWYETVNGENFGSIKYVSGSSTMIQGICPDGWHVPSDEEFKTLEMYLGMSASSANSTTYRGTDEGTKLKSTTGWYSNYSNGNGTNSSGWNGLPGGSRDDSGGWFYRVGMDGSWWSSSEGSSSDYAWRRLLSFEYAQVYRYSYPKSYGFSVRCLQN